MKTKFKLSIISIVLFVISLLLLAYAVFVIVNINEYISQIIESGQASLKENFFDIFNSYMSGMANYVLFAILFVVLGIKSLKKVEAEDEITVEVFEIDEDFDDDEFTYTDEDDDVDGSADSFDDSSEDVGDSPVDTDDDADEDKKDDEDAEEKK